MLHYHDDGPADAPALVLAHALGVDMTIWNDVLPLLPEGLRIIRYDMRGHGRSAVPAPAYSMGALVRDTEALLDHLGVRDSVFVGLSIGGMVAQGLAVKRLDLVRGLVLSNTAAKIGHPGQWRDRIETAQTRGMAGLADATMERWFSRAFRAGGAHEPVRDLFCRIDPQGYAGACAAISGTDFYTPTSGLRLPTLGIAGSEDRSTPPDLVRETVELIPGADFRLIRQAGHLPCVDRPENFAILLSEFLARISHV